MTKLEQLIQELCPNGMEYKKLGEVLKYEQPTKYIVGSTDYNDNYKIPVLTAGQTFILGYTNEKENVFFASKENPVIIFDDFTTAFKWVDFNFKVKSSAMKILLNNSLEQSILKYVYYAMQLIQYNSFEHGRKWISIYSNIEIPLPPLEVQKEIVHILDEYSKLEEELRIALEKELEARKKQFEYYREKLLTFNNRDNLLVERERETNS